MPQFLFIFILFGVKGASVAEIMRIVRWRQWLICGFGPGALCLGGLLQHLWVQSFDQKPQIPVSSNISKPEDLLLLNSPPALQCAASNVLHFICHKVKRSRASLMRRRRGCLDTIMGLKSESTTVHLRHLWNLSKRRLSIFMNVFSVATSPRWAEVAARLKTPR